MHVVVGNAGYELSWFANPTPPNYWDKIVLEHGYSRCLANMTTLSCEVGPSCIISSDRPIMYYLMRWAYHAPPHDEDAYEVSLKAWLLLLLGLLGQYCTEDLSSHLPNAAAACVLQHVCLCV